MKLKSYPSAKKIECHPFLDSLPTKDQFYSTFGVLLDRSTGRFKRRSLPIHIYFECLEHVIMTVLTRARLLLKYIF